MRAEEHHDELGQQKWFFSDQQCDGAGSRNAQPWGYGLIHAYGGVRHVHQQGTGPDVIERYAAVSLGSIHAQPMTTLRWVVSNLVFASRSSGPGLVFLRSAHACLAWKE